MGTRSAWGPLDSRAELHLVPNPWYNREACGPTANASREDKPMDATKRIDELRAQVRYHAHRYHVLDDPVMVAIYNAAKSRLLKE